MKHSPYPHSILAFIIALITASASFGAENDSSDTSLRFTKSEGDWYDFDTGVLKGSLRKGQEGRSIGLKPVTYTPNGMQFSAGEGLFNHYRVFTLGKRYGYGARRWPSTSELREDGSVEVVWAANSERPFELRGTYRFVAPHIVDVETSVKAVENLEAFEVFLASYYEPSFTDSLVWGSKDPRGSSNPGFVSADRELGDWQAFPRDSDAKEMIEDGRWDLEPHPLEWTMLPNYDLPLAIRRDPETGLTVIILARTEDCFGIFTPYGEEKHYSNYFSLFGYDIEKGKTATAHSRLVVLLNPSEEEILRVANDYLKPSS